eukprot:118719_1
MATIPSIQTSKSSQLIPQSKPIANVIYTDNDIEKMGCGEYIKISLCHLLSVYLWAFFCILCIATTAVMLMFVPLTKQTTPTDHIYYNSWAIISFHQIPYYILLSMSGCMQVAVIFYSTCNSKPLIMSSLFFLIVTIIYIITEYIYGLYLWKMDLDGAFGTIILIGGMVLSLLLFLRSSPMFHDKSKIIVWYYVMIPVCILTPIHVVASTYFIRLYDEMSLGKKFLIRVIYWPLLVDAALIISEKIVRRMPHKNVSIKNHLVFTAQCAISIVGRILIFSAGSLSAVTLISFGNTIKELVFHRWNRVISKLLFQLRKLFCIGPLSYFKPKQKCFVDYYDTESVQSYRSNIINGEFFIEITFLFTESIFYLTARAHKLLFVETFPKSGSPNVKYIIYITLIQFVAQLITSILAIILEMYVNHVNLYVMWKQRSRLQYISELIWCVWLFLVVYGTARTFPNTINCDNVHDICSCSFVNQDMNGYHC